MLGGRLADAVAVGLKLCEPRIISVSIAKSKMSADGENLNPSPSTHNGFFWSYPKHAFFSYAATVPFKMLKHRNGLFHRFCFRVVFVNCGSGCPE